MKNMMRQIFILGVILVLPTLCTAKGKADLVVVHKSLLKMVLYSNTEIIGEYRISLGANPKGHKQQEGDERTPEGDYFLDYKKSDSSFYKSIHISYPNENDKRKAKSRGVNPGGFIMIHGQRNGLGWLSVFTQRFNWTDGCIAVTNKEMDEIWELVPVGTPIRILP